MRVWLLILMLLACGGAHAAGPELCTLSHIRKNPRVWLATEIGRYALVQKLKQTPQPRLRSDIPEILKDQKQFNAIVLNDKREVKALEYEFNKCIYDQIAGRFGSEADISKLFESDEGRQFWAELDEHMKGLWDQQPSVVEKAACYHEPQVEKRDRCWREIAEKTMGSALAAQALTHVRSSIRSAIIHNDMKAISQVAEGDRQVFRQYFEVNDKILLMNQKIEDEDLRWRPRLGR